MLTLILLALSIIFLSGVLSMVEASLFSYSIRRARLAAARGGWMAKKVLAVREKPFRAIAALVILSSAVTVGGSITVGSLAARQFSSEGIGIFSAILIFVSIIVSEIIPKNIGERRGYIVFPIAAFPLKWLAWILAPLIWCVEKIAKPFTSGASPFTTSEEEIALLTKVGAKEGTIEPDEAEMIQRVFRLNDITAGDMMTPKAFVAFIDGNKTVGEMAEFVKGAKHTRLPVFEGDTNHVVGMVHIRELLKALTNGENDRKVLDYARDVMIVPESRVADELLRDFQEKRSQLAVVVSEYGNVVGVVGIEDILEELVGEIIDEKDVAPELIKRISKNEIIAHGQTRIAFINHFFNTDLKSRKTLNGFLLDKFGSIPQQKQVLEFSGLRFQIEEIGGNQIERVSITKKSESGEVN